jgi:hypothetical protein
MSQPIIQLQQIETEFKQQFPGANFASLLSSQQYNEIENFMQPRFEPIMEQVVDAQEFVNVLSNNAPTVYAFAKSQCVVDAVKYDNDHILGIDSPENGIFHLSVDYHTGESLSISSDSSLADVQSYLTNSFAICAKQFQHTTQFDADIKVFQTDVSQKTEEYVLAAEANSVQTEL